MLFFATSNSILMKKEEMEVYFTGTKIIGIIFVMTFRNVEIKVGNRSYAAQILILENCVFFWVGTRCELDSFYFARNDRGLALLETLDTAHAHLDRFTGKISELFPEKQVIYSVNFLP